MQMAAKSMQPVLPKPNPSTSSITSKSLSKIEDKELRKKLRNRQSALAARERKKARMLQLERTVGELQLANGRLNQENVELKQVIVSMRATISNQIGCPNQLVQRQKISYNRNPAGSNDGSLFSNGITSIQSTVIVAEPSFQTVPDPNHGINHQPRRASDSDHLPYGYCTSSDLRKRSNNLLCESQIKSEKMQEQILRKVPEKRRKSVPSIMSSCVSNAYSWPLTTNAIPESMPATTMENFSEDIPKLASQRRSSYQTPPLPCYQAYTNDEVFTVESQVQSGGHSSLPSINRVPAGNDSAREEFIPANTSECSEVLNFVNNNNTSSQWPVADTFIRNEYECSGSTGYSQQESIDFHANLNSVKPFDNTAVGFSDSHQHPSKEFTELKQPGVSRVPCMYRQEHEHPGGNGSKTFDEILNWISESN